MISITSCEGETLRFDLFLEGNLIKKDAEIRTNRPVEWILLGKKVSGYDLAQPIRSLSPIKRYLQIEYITAPSRPSKIIWQGSKHVDLWVATCEEVQRLQTSYLAINLVPPFTSKCDKAHEVTVDLFSNGKLVKSNVLLPIVYVNYVNGIGMVASLVESARLYMSPNVKKMMGRIYVTEKKPANITAIPWNSVGTYLTDVPDRLDTCTNILDYQTKYVAIDLAPACVDETLIMDISWRGKIIKKNYALPIHYVHGVRKFGESRVDLVEAVRTVIPSNLLSDYDTIIQFYSRSNERKEPLDWEKRRTGVPRLMVTCDQIKTFQRRWITVNLEPVIKMEGMECHMCCFDVQYHDEVNNKFFCSITCYHDSL